MISELNTNETFIENFENLIKLHYPSIYKEEGLFVMKEYDLKFKVLRTAFYFYLDPKVYRKLEGFKYKATWTVDFLKLSITYTASTGKTYSYPGLREYLKNNDDDNIMTASYVFTCVSYALNFFTTALDKNRINSNNELIRLNNPVIKYDENGNRHEYRHL